MAVDQLDSARQPCWSKQTCIHVYECPAILRLLLHFALGVSMDIVAEALAGAAFITSAVSVGFAPASGAVGAGTGFGATGKLEYSFCRSGPGRTSEETPQPRPALRPNLHRSSSHAPHSKTCRCNSVNVSGTEVQLLLSQLHSTGQSHQVEGRNSVLFVAGGAGGASANKL